MMHVMHAGKAGTPGAYVLLKTFTDIEILNPLLNI